MSQQEPQQHTELSEYQDLVDPDYTETIEIDKSAPQNVSDDEADGGDFDALAAEQYGDEGEGESEAVLDLDDLGDDLKPKGDTEAHDGDQYDDSIVNMAQHTIKPHTDSIFTISLDEQAQLLATGSGDDTASLIDLVTKEVLFHWQDFDDSVVKVLFSPQYDTDVKFLAIASMSGDIRIFSLQHLLEFKAQAKETGVDKESLSLEPSIVFNIENDLDMIVFHPTRQLLAAGCSDGQVWLFNLQTQEQNVYYGHNDGITSLLFSLDGNGLISGSLDGQVIINYLTALPSADSSPPKKQLKYPKVGKESSPIISITPHPDPNVKQIAVGTEAGGLYHASLLDHAFGLHNDTAHGDSIEAIKYQYQNPQTLYIYSSSVEGTLKVWNWSDNLKARFTVQLPYAVTSFGFHPVARLLIVASHDGVIRIFKSGEGHPIFEFTGHQDAILDMVVTTDHIYTSSDDKTVRVFDFAQLPAEHLQPPQTTPGQPGPAGNRPGVNIVGGNVQRRPVARPPVQKPGAKPE